ncbi:GntR family transcriptional regulator [Mycolicibacterium goodii]|uniref:GntR family transcriptional regulator n=1 Tax=Mycolicibacterium goodii TaxID=134601 RepID=A0ABS6HQE3_MYCGD|nr:GntR family transcriptional regulator [Mycolicibacterium goodii]OKH75256.1 GntR family transcriptional regulator [Mycobacterium sp. SWH-M5]MBU8814460.1 GntR family transcriptional regulator [Mycolicibacterium goodii]MBU8824841.1 GntR family transcriptional regulator [Mycolicibacterium goodii]MBU8828998.1 GntR family transcriptional regulator [Mycolicibacterium goodii]MBU8839840.1 GntR family transcriptional regulator [Mycolicibacterium goodii]
MAQALHVKIAQDLRDRVRRGELPLGAALPSESQLCAQWKSSRGPVRQALATLRAEGLITGGPGKPPVVCSTAVGQPFDTLLSYSAWAHSIGRTPGQHTLELSLRKADEHAAAGLHVDVGSTVVQFLRLRLLDGAPSMLERATFVERVGRLLFDFDCDSGSIWAYLQSRGVKLATASHTIDAVGADPVDAANLQVPEGTPLLRQRRTTRGVDGEVIEFHDDRYLPAVITFTLENTLDTRTSLARNATP